MAARPPRSPKGRGRRGPKPEGGGFASTLGGAPPASAFVADFAAGLGRLLVAREGAAAAFAGGFLTVRGLRVPLPLASSSAIPIP